MQTHLGRSMRAANSKQKGGEDEEERQPPSHYGGPAQAPAEPSDQPNWVCPRTADLEMRALNSGSQQNTTMHCCVFTLWTSIGLPGTLQRREQHAAGKRKQRNCVCRPPPAGRGVAPLPPPPQMPAPDGDPERQERLQVLFHLYEELSFPPSLPAAGQES